MRNTLQRAGVIACLVALAGCAVVALMPVTPVLAMLAGHTDHVTASEIAALEKKQDWPGMLRYAEAKLRAEPRNSDWMFLRGYSLARQGKHAEAIVAYNQALQLSPEDESSWIFLGNSQRELGQFDQAIRTFEQALRYRPESATSYLALADTYAKQKRFERAVPNYRESVRYEPNLLEGWYGLAVAYQQLGLVARRDEALAGVRKLSAPAAAAFEKEYVK